MNERAIAFIDEANIAKQANSLGIEIDYQKLLFFLKSQYKLARAYLYTGSDLSLPRVNDFIYMLKRAGYRVVHRRSAPRSDGSIKANLDIALAVDMVEMAGNYDTAILFSGDGDFAPALEAISRKAVRVVLISWEPHTSGDIIDLADEYIDLKSLSSQINYVRKPLTSSINSVAVKSPSHPEVIPVIPVTPVIPVIPVIPVTPVIQRLSTLLNKAGLRPCPEFRLDVLTMLVDVANSLDSPKYLNYIREVLAERTSFSKSKLQDILQAVVTGGCVLDELGKPVLSFTLPFVTLVSSDVNVLEQRCIESYLRSILKADPNALDSKDFAMKFNEVTGGKLPKNVLLSEMVK